MHLSKVIKIHRALTCSSSRIMVWQGGHVEKHASADSLRTLTCICTTHTHTHTYTRARVRAATSPSARVRLLACHAHSTRQPLTPGLHSKPAFYQWLASSGVASQGWRQGARQVGLDLLLFYLLLINTKKRTHSIYTYTHYQFNIQLYLSTAHLIGTTGGSR